MRCRAKTCVRNGIETIQLVVAIFVRKINERSDGVATPEQAVRLRSGEFQQDVGRFVFRKASFVLKALRIGDDAT